MSSSQKNNMVIYLTSKLSQQINHMNQNADCELSELLDKVSKILQCVVILKKYKRTYSSPAIRKSISVQFLVILKLIKALQKVYRDSLLYDDWKTHKTLRAIYPEIYNSVIEKRLDAKTAYSWCKGKENNRGRLFIRKLMQLINADEVVFWENNKCLNEEQVFVRELVRLTSKYQSSAIIISSLYDKINTLTCQLTSAQNRQSELETYIKNSLDVIGGIEEVIPISPIRSLPAAIYPLLSVDGEGTGGLIYINKDTIAIAEKGDNYTKSEIVSFLACGKIFYLKVKEVSPKGTDVAATITLDKIDFGLPIWTRLYTSLYPGKMDVLVLMQIKQEIMEYGTQYVILKHGTSKDDKYDEALACAF